MNIATRGLVVPLAAAGLVIAAFATAYAQPEDRAPGECDNPAVGATASTEVAEYTPEAGCEIAHETTDPAMGCEGQDAGSHAPGTGREDCAATGSIDDLKESMQE